MKIRTKFITFITTAFILLGTSVALASSWTISSVHVPAWGGSAVTSEANVKATNSSSASFNGDVLPNSFGYTARLVDSNHASRSNTAGVYVDKTTHASGNTLTINHYGYAKVYSSNVEPNSSYVKLHFSSDSK